MNINKQNIDIAISKVLNDVNTTYQSEPKPVELIDDLGLFIFSFNRDVIKKEFTDYFYKAIRKNIGLNPTYGFVLKELDDMMRNGADKTAELFCELISKNDVDKNRNFISKSTDQGCV